MSFFYASTQGYQALQSCTYLIFSAIRSYALKLDAVQNSRRVQLTLDNEFISTESLVNLMDFQCLNVYK